MELALPFAEALSVALFSFDASHFRTLSLDSGIPDERHFGQRGQGGTVASDASPQPRHVP